MRADLDPDIRLLRGVADPSRLAILRRLQCGGSVAACDFDCCEVRQPTISHHLRVLREAGWVRAERRGTGVYYSIDPGAAERFREIATDFAPAPGTPARRREGARAEESVDGTDSAGQARPGPAPQFMGSGQ